MFLTIVAKKISEFQKFQFYTYYAIASAFSQESQFNSFRAYLFLTMINTFFGFNAVLTIRRCFSTVNAPTNNLSVIIAVGFLVALVTYFGIRKHYNNVKEVDFSDSERKYYGIFLLFFIVGQFVWIKLLHDCS
jgi:hypothetical protein